jgi:hypothetical protein
VSVKSKSQDKRVFTMKLPLRCRHCTHTLLSPDLDTGCNTDHISHVPSLLNPNTGTVFVSALHFSYTDIWHSLLVFRAVSSVKEPMPSELEWGARTLKCGLWLVGWWQRCSLLLCYWLVVSYSCEVWCHRTRLCLMYVS